jgi:hypothetical protein
MVAGAPWSRTTTTEPPASAPQARALPGRAASLPPAAAPAPVQVASGLPPLAPLSRCPLRARRRHRLPRPLPRAGASHRLRQPVCGRSERGRARPRAGRGGDRLRQRRLRASAKSPAAHHRLRMETAASTPRPGWCCSTCTAPPASSSASKAWRSTTRSSSAGRRRSGIRCPSWWPIPLVDEPLVPSGSRDGIDVGWVCPASSTSKRWPGFVADPADAAALGLRLGELRRSTPRRRCSCPPCSACGPGQSLEMRWMSPANACLPCCRSRAHRRARCRPGVLADAPGGLAPGQPRRPVRRGGHRLLRHLRGVARRRGSLRAARCASAATAKPRAARTCRASATCPPASWNRQPRRRRSSGVELATSSCRASWWATSAPR